jgi:mediator of RNA polymerase II transcription subunit 6
MSVGTQYIDIFWLKTFGVFRGNVLEYFYESPFFDPTSNNQLIRTQGVAPEHMKGMVGMEYVLDELNMCEPHLYVIKKQHRESPRKSELLEIYYVIDGIIYQSPDLLQLFRSRISKASYYLGTSFSELQGTTSYTSKQGRKCWSRQDQPEQSSGSDAGDAMVVDQSTTSHPGQSQSDKGPKARAAESIRDFPPFTRVMDDLSSF